MRGVKVHVMARPPHTLKKEKLIEGVGGLRIMDDVGIKVHKLKHLKLHGKMLLADGLRAIVGSINLAPGSFDSRRELAIEVHDDEVVKPSAQSRASRLEALPPARSYATTDCWPIWKIGRVSKAWPSVCPAKHKGKSAAKQN